MPAEPAVVPARQDPTVNFQELSAIEVHKENFVLDACIKLRDCLDAIKGDSETFFKNNVSTDDEAYLVFEDLLVENLQAEFNEVFNLDEIDTDTDSSSGSDIDSYSEVSSDEEEGSESASEESDDSLVAAAAESDVMDES